MKQKKWFLIWGMVLCVLFLVFSGCLETDPVLCAECGEILADCTCDDLNPVLCPDCGLPIEDCICIDLPCPDCGLPFEDCICDNELDPGDDVDLILGPTGPLSGTGLGEHFGFSGIIRVTLVIEAGLITDVTIVDGIGTGYPETAGLGSAAIIMGERNIRQRNTVDNIDIVAGATITSEAVREAAQKALAAIIAAQS